MSVAARSGLVSVAITASGVFLVPSPFPGMDPFLEHPAVFPGLHDRFITYLSEALQQILPSPYFAEINERLRVETSDRTIGPDVDVVRGEQPPSPELRGGAATALAPGTVQPVIVTVPLEEFRETYLEIRTSLGEGERVVTNIEVLSPTNKIPGPKGQGLYQQKQQEVLQSEIHLVEIDLLRGGAHSTAVSLRQLQKQCPPFDYHVCVHYFDQPGKFVIYPIQLEQRLPDIAIPLLPGDSPVLVSLQAILDRCYDAGPYRRRLHYDCSRLDPRLPEQRLAWVNEILARSR
jgi:hypothetical protein